MIKTGVSFETADKTLKELFDRAETAAKGNLADFGGRRVLVEGGGYPFIWPETQPMGGEMYAKRDIEAALNNQLFFLDYQNGDGRIAGHIRFGEKGITPCYHHIQGCSYPSHALNMFYWTGASDLGYLGKLYDGFEAFDNYLWKYRDSDGDGCLESWCVWDTGEDEAFYMDGGRDWHYGENPPYDDPVFPLESVDFMGITYDLRSTLARISAILGNGKANFWLERAEAIRRKIRDYLWDDERGFCFMRDKNNVPMEYVGHNNLKLMYHGAMYPAMAKRFLDEHLLNPEEFFTPMPLPSCAVNNRYFRNVRQNNWSGQCEGLTYQRAIRATENYGFLSAQTQFGKKLLEAASRHMVFPQQFDPFTGEPSEPDFRATYGPTILAALEYISRFYGIHQQYGRIYWGALEGDSEYTQNWGDRSYTIVNRSGEAEGFIDGERLFRVTGGVRVTTGLEGEELTVANITSEPVHVKIAYRGAEMTAKLAPDRIVCASMMLR